MEEEKEVKRRRKRKRKRKGRGEGREEEEEEENEKTMVGWVRECVREQHFSFFERHFTHHRMCSRTIECVVFLQKVFLCSLLQPSLQGTVLITECVLLL